MEEKYLEITDKILSKVFKAEKDWGTDFDSKNTLNDWNAYVTIYMARAIKINTPREEVLDGLYKAAGLIITAIRWYESDKMPKRHYDD